MEDTCNYQINDVLLLKRGEAFQRVLTPLLYTLKVNCVALSVDVKGRVIVQLQILWSLLLSEESRFCIGE
jgi:hypothetical protein